MKLFLILGLLWAKPQWKTLTFTNGATLKVEVVKDDADRQKGLMGRTEIPENQGMLFVFDQPQRLSFWMKNTYIDLTIGYFDENKVLRETYDMKGQNMLERQQNLRSYFSKCKCKFALEVNQGWFKKNKVKPGLKFSLRSAK